MKNKEIYSSTNKGFIYSPFSFKIDKMRQLILINFEKDPDSSYNVFELQMAKDEIKNTKFLIIGYQINGSADVYLQESYPLCNQNNILNNVNFYTRTLHNTKFDIYPDKLDVYFEFEDKFGRYIKVSVFENNLSKKKPFFLLAPVGTISESPNLLPIYSLYKMAFTRRKNSSIEIFIGNKKHKPDTFPLPIDFSKNYFTRYSADTFNIDWNKNFKGLLLPINYQKNQLINKDNIIYETVNNNQRIEIKNITTSNSFHKINLNFNPPFPDISCLRTNIANKITGKFKIRTDHTKGNISGRYIIISMNNEINIKILPCFGWNPRENRIILKILFSIIKIFKNWPKTYEWNSKIIFDSNNIPIMNSTWKRIDINEK